MGPADPLEKVVLFDGVCNLCTSAVQFVIRHNSKKNIKFASLQSDFGQSQLQRNSAPQEIETIIFIKRGTVFFKSDAALEICEDLDGLYPILKVFKVVPHVVRDWIYNLIAIHRYRWFGKKEQCWIPTPELQSRFIS
jgi:predicted DCC family thiol-disulfide oxidoreductase YuxK